MFTYPQGTTIFRGHRGCDRMVVGFTPSCATSAYHTNVVRTSNPAHGKVCSIQHYVIKLISDLRQVSSFPRELWFPPPIKLTTMI